MKAVTQDRRSGLGHFHLLSALHVAHNNVWAGLGDPQVNSPLVPEKQPAGPAPTIPLWPEASLPRERSSGCSRASELSLRTAYGTGC